MRTAVISATVAVVTTWITLKAPQGYDRLKKMLDPPPTATAGFWQTPTIQGYGPIHMEAKTAFHPDSQQHYKVVFQIEQGKMPPDKVSHALDRVARTVNLYVASGVPLSQLNFVVAIAGSATPMVLDNAHYRSIYGVDNPNLPLFKKLRAAGVTVTVCDQAVAGHRYPAGWVDSSVTRALSSLVTITTLEHQGYTLMPL